MIVYYLILSIATSLAAAGCVIAGLSTAALLFKWAAFAWLLSAVLSGSTQD